MITKPSFTVGVKDSGAVELIAIGSPEECKQAFLAEAEKPSGKYQFVQVYRKPPYWKRRQVSAGEKPSSAKKKKAASKD